MDTRDGRIYDSELMRKMFGEIQTQPNGFFEALSRSHEKRKGVFELKYFKAMEVPPTEVQLARTPPRIGRNEPCPCGSGKKFKKCCLLQNWKDRYGK